MALQALIADHAQGSRRGRGFAIDHPVLSTRKAAQAVIVDFEARPTCGSRLRAFLMIRSSRLIQSDCRV